MVPPDKCVLRQSPGSIALFRMLQYILFVKTENAFESRCLLPGGVAQHGVHGRGIYNLIGIENIFRVPGAV